MFFNTQSRYTRSNSRNTENRKNYSRSNSNRKITLSITGNVHNQNNRSRKCSNDRSGQFSNNSKKKYSINCSKNYPNNIKIIGIITKIRYNEFKKLN